MRLISAYSDKITHLIVSVKTLVIKIYSKNLRSYVKVFNTFNIVIL